jgi:hypothetical protein
MLEYKLLGRCRVVKGADCKSLRHTLVRINSAHFKFISISTIFILALLRSYLIVTYILKLLLTCHTRNYSVQSYKKNED